MNQKNTSPHLSSKKSSTSSCSSRPKKNLKKSTSSNDNIVAEQIAIAAARWLADSERGSYRWACRKAANQLGIRDQHLWPSAEQVQEALNRQLQLLDKDTSSEDLKRLRSHALIVMKRLSTFQPTLFGALVDGTATAHSRIDLAVFIDTVEELLVFLLNEDIPFNVGEIELRFDRKGTRRTPMVEFIAGDADVRILILPPQQRRLPIDPLNRTRFQRMSLAELETIADEPASRALANNDD